MDLPVTLMASDFPQFIEKCIPKEETSRISWFDTGADGFGNPVIASSNPAGFQTKSCDHLHEESQKNKGEGWVWNQTPQESQSRTFFAIFAELHHCTRVLQKTKCDAQEGLCSVPLIADTNSFTDAEEINVEIAVEPCRASDLKAS